MLSQTYFKIDSDLLPQNEMKLITFRNNDTWKVFDFSKMFNPVYNIMLLSSSLGF